MKKLFPILLLLMLATCLLPSAFAGEEPVIHESGDFKYILLDDGSAEITLYTGEAEELEIPLQLDGHNVTSIGDEAFSYCKSLTSVTIGGSVTSIGNEAFYYCNALTNVTIGESVTSIGDYAFGFCYSLPTVTIGGSVSSIGANPFHTCSALSSITVSPHNDFFYTIDGVLFEKSTKTLICYPSALDASSYVIPQGILAIGDFAFYCCSSLASVTISDTVTSIGDSAFRSCDSLTFLTIGSSVASIGASAFAGCHPLTAVTIPDSVTVIGDSAFRFCESLSSVAIGSSVSSMGANPFSSCHKLTSITISPHNDFFYAIDGVLFEKSTKTLICYPCALDASSYVIPKDTLAIGDSAFSFCEFLTSVTIEGSVISIGDYAFSRCTSLTSVVIGGSVDSIGNSAFFGCDQIILSIESDSYAESWAIENNIEYNYSNSLN